jgi:hypothetical protein
MKSTKLRSKNLLKKEFIRKGIIKTRIKIKVRVISQNNNEKHSNHKIMIKLISRLKQTLRKQMSIAKLKIIKKGNKERNLNRINLNSPSSKSNLNSRNNRNNLKQESQSKPNKTSLNRNSRSKIASTFEKLPFS